MADQTYAVKVSEETKEQVQKMVEVAGCTSKEFFEKLLQVYQMETLKEGSPRNSEDLREIEALLSRVNQVICNLAIKGDTEVFIIRQQQQEKELQQFEQLKAVEEKNNFLLASLKNAEEELGMAQEAKDTAEKQAKITDDALAQSNELVTEYRCKIDTLTTLAEKNQTKADEYDKAITQVTQLTNQLDNLSEKMEQLKNDHQREIEKMVDGLLHSQDELQKEQARTIEKIDFIEKGFQKERESFDKERAGFEARITDLKQSFEREVQLVKENADAKVEISRKRQVKGNSGTEKRLAQTKV